MEDASLTVTCQLSSADVSILPQPIIRPVLIRQYRGQLTFYEAQIRVERTGGHSARAVPPRSQRRIILHPNY